MAKVLVSFLGTGPLKNDKGNREYRNANYEIEGKRYNTSFVSAALVEHLQIETRIIIGTAKSMWEEYYRYFHEEDDDFDSELYINISDYTLNATSKTVDFPFVEELESKLLNTKLIILDYGLNEIELEKNLLKILQIEEILNTNDELFVDVTHGFRSFPLFAQEIILYIKHVSNKSIELKKFYYGMLDVNRELGYTPIVDLSIIQKMNDWIIGVSQFTNKSDGSMLVDLLKPNNSDIAKLVDNFSKAFNLNYSHEIKKQYEKILDYDFMQLNPLERLMAKKGFEEFQNHFDSKKKHSLFQLDLANWYYKKNLFGVAYLTLTEALVTFVAEDVDITKPLDKDVRGKAKKIIHTNKYKEIGRLYNSTNKIRRNVAHMLDKRHDTYLNDINNLGKRINTAYNLLT